MNWKEFKKTIAEVFAKKLNLTDFQNGGYKMYRFREHFVDIIQIYPNTQNTKYAIEFGSHPRKDKLFKSNKDCSFFMFRSRYTINDKEVWYEIMNSREESIMQLENLVEQVFEFGLTFFKNFETPQDGIEILKSSKLDKYLFLKPNVKSLVFDSNIRTLETIVHSG